MQLVERFDRVASGHSHDSYLMLVQTRSLDVTDRNHFLASALTVMRSVSVDLIRESQAERRGGGRLDLTVNTRICDSSPAKSADDALLRRAQRRRNCSMRGCNAAHGGPRLGEGAGVSLHDVESLMH